MHKPFPQKRLHVLGCCFVSPLTSVNTLMSREQYSARHLGKLLIFLSLGLLRRKVGKGVLPLCLVVTTNERDASKVPMLGKFGLPPTSLPESPFSLDQVLTSFICKEPDGKYFRCCEPCALCPTCSTLTLWRESSHR